MTVPARIWTVVRSLLIPAALLGTWELLSRGGAAATYAFVPLRQVATAARTALSNGELIGNLIASAEHACLGLVAGGLAGLLLGACLGASRICDRILGPLFHGLRQVPLLGLAPLIGLSFGNGAGAKLLVIALAAFYPVALATAGGVRNVERAHLELGRALTLDRRQVFRHILLPAAAPAIASGFLQALAFAWLATIGSELLFTASAGLGSFMQQAEANGRMEMVIVGITAIALVGLAMNGLVIRAVHWLLPWHAVEQK